MSLKGLKRVNSDKIESGKICKTTEYTIESKMSRVDGKLISLYNQKKEHLTNELGFIKLNIHL
jgi:hypothetical protein